MMWGLTSSKGVGNSIRTKNLGRGRERSSNTFCVVKMLKLPFEEQVGIQDLLWQLKLQWNKKSRREMSRKNLRRQFWLDLIKMLVRFFFRKSLILIKKPTFLQISDLVTCHKSQVIRKQVQWTENDIQPSFSHNKIRNNTPKIPNLCVLEYSRSNKIFFDSLFLPNFYSFCSVYHCHWLDWMSHETHVT